MALITQSVDSRNHVIVATSVTADLVASLLRFPVLDTLVGLAVTGLILKSTVELAIETIRSLGEVSGRASLTWAGSICQDKRWPGVGADGQR